MPGMKVGGSGRWIWIIEARWGIYPAFVFSISVLCLNVSFLKKGASSVCCSLDTTCCKSLAHRT
jgi:hypothetical protein